MRRESIIGLGGEYQYGLPIGPLRALEKKCDAGPMWILTRLQQGSWRVNDITETIRLGLIGGGMEADAARKIVQREVEDVPIAEFVPLAIAIIMLGLFPDPENEENFADELDEDDEDDEDEGVDEQPGEQESLSQEASSDGPTSTSGEGS